MRRGGASWWRFCSPTIVEPASDWLVRTCNASLELAAAAGTRCGFCRCWSGRAVLATAPGGRVAFLALGWRTFLLHPSFSPTLTHTLSRPLCRGRRKHLRQIKNDAERPQETCTPRSASRPRAGHTFFILLLHETNKNLGKDKCSCLAVRLIRKGLPFRLAMRLSYQGVLSQKSHSETTSPRFCRISHPQSPLIVWNKGSSFGVRPGCKCWLVHFVRCVTLEESFNL